MVAPHGMREKLGDEVHKLLVVSSQVSTHTAVHLSTITLMELAAFDLVVWEYTFLFLFAVTARLDEFSTGGKPKMGIGRAMSRMNESRLRQ